MAGPGPPINEGLKPSPTLRDSRALTVPSFATARGGGRRLTSGDWVTLMLEAVDVILDVDRFLL